MKLQNLLCLAFAAACCSFAAAASEEAARKAEAIQKNLKAGEELLKPVIGDDTRALHTMLESMINVFSKKFGVDSEELSQVALLAMKRMQHMSPEEIQSSVDEVVHSQGLQPAEVAKLENLLSQLDFSGVRDESDGL